MGGVRAATYADALRREEHAPENCCSTRGRWPHRVRRRRAFQRNNEAIHSEGRQPDRITRDTVHSLWLLDLCA